jgi:hypothetical protein
MAARNKTRRSGIIDDVMYMKETSIIDAVLMMGLCCLWSSSPYLLKNAACAALFSFIINAVCIV